MKVGIVIPCYNEEKRLPRNGIDTLAANPNIHLLLVDDGSSDGTPKLLEDLRREFPRVQVHRMPQNSGKGEAVRAGLNLLATQDLEWIGFIDADFATPAKEVLRVIQAIPEEPVQVLLCSRVRLLGYRIQRKMSRHYLGRVFATLASVILRLPVYDTQCGCKFFRNTPLLKRVLAQPFRSRWVFDIEMLKRYMDFEPTFRTSFDESFREVPLWAWQDVRGSKLGPRQMIGAVLDLLKLAF